MPAPETLGATTGASPGKDTSEYKVAQGAKWWGIAGMVLGVVVAFGGQASGLFPEDSTAAVWLGGAIALAGKIQHMLIAAGYIAQRGNVKVAASREKAPKDTRHIS